MSLRVQAHGAIWVEGKLVVHRHALRGREVVTLPGGRVKDRESVTDALVREAQEEIEREIEVGDLLFAAQVLGTSSQDVLLIFAAKLLQPADTEQLDLVDPAGPQAAAVLPAVLGELARYRDGVLEPRGPRWLGNLHRLDRSLP